MTHLYVSRRNLLTLLAKLDGAPRDSRCTIGAPANYPPLFITAEEDDVHYAHESRLDSRPGMMHPDTELALLHSEAAEPEL